MKVLKFGGTSDAKNIKLIIEREFNKNEPYLSSFKYEAENSGQKLRNQH